MSNPGMSNPVMSNPGMADHAFPYLRLRLTVRPLDGPSRDLPSHALPPTRLRRVLGKALIDLFCPFGRPRCQDWPKLQGRSGPSKAHELCPQAKQCAYGVLFAASTNRRPPFALYVRPPRSNRRELQAEITLFNDAWQFYPWALRGLDRALDVGVGKERQRWGIVEVVQLQSGRPPKRLCRGEVTQLPTDVQPSTIPLTRGALLDSFETRRESAQGVELLSPTRFIHDGRILFGGTPVPFQILIARTLDRLRNLYGDSTAQLLPSDLLPLLDTEAKKVPIVEARTRWVEQKDYSARFRNELKLGGKVGNLVYGRGAGRFLPILKAGEILHVGKNVTSGCGRIAVAG